MEGLSTFAGGSRKPGKVRDKPENQLRRQKPCRYDLHNLNAEKVPEIDSTRIGSHFSCAVGKPKASVSFAFHCSIFSFCSQLTTDTFFPLSACSEAEPLL